MLCRKLEKKFDLYYYDGLARQEEEIKLTVGKVVICKISLQKRQGNETRASSVVAEMRVTRARFVFVWHLIGSKWAWSFIPWPITERETKVILDYLFDLNTFNENKNREYIWRHTGFSSVALSEYNWLSYAMMWNCFGSYEEKVCGLEIFSGWNIVEICSVNDVWLLPVVPTINQVIIL